MYMPGRLRTASRPLRTWMLSSLYAFPFGASVGDVVIFDRSIARESGQIVQGVQVSPPATNLNSFNNLTTFTRTVNPAYHGFPITLPARTRKSRRAGCAGTMSRSVTEISV